MILEAILKINPDAIATVRGSDLNTCEIEWHQGTQPIAKELILAKVVELQAEYEAKQYQRDRQYPSIAEQLDMLYWDKVNGTENWLNSIESVKNRFPKA
jgi:hypothetical protein